MQHIVIIGATSCIAEHCAREWVSASAVHLTLVGRDLAKTERVAQDLRVRNPQAMVDAVTLDFLEASTIEAWVSALTQRTPVDVVLIAHGVLADQSQCQSSLLACEAALHVNGVSPVLFAEAFAKPMTHANHGTIAIIGSVAGDRGRQSNYVYGAAKGLVARYAQGMQHRLANTAVRVVLIKPGPTDTPMTQALKAQGQKMASPEQVAHEIVNGIRAGKPVVYSPGIWRIIMWVVMHLPRFVFDKLRI
jgi:short-subunit dehydrogenase